MTAYAIRSDQNIVSIEWYLIKLQGRSINHWMVGLLKKIYLSLCRLSRDRPRYQFAYIWPIPILILIYRYQYQYRLSFSPIIGKISALEKYWIGGWYVYPNISVMVSAEISARNIYRYRLDPYRSIPSYYSYKRFSFLNRYFFSRSTFLPPPSLSHQTPSTPHLTFTVYIYILNGKEIITLNVW
jgi:hypothetical protein